MAIANIASDSLIQVLQGCKSLHWICLLCRAELATNAETLGIMLVSNLLLGEQGCKFNIMQKYARRQNAYATTVSVTVA